MLITPGGGETHHVPFRLAPASARPSRGRSATHRRLHRRAGTDQRGDGQDNNPALPLSQALIRLSSAEPNHTATSAGRPKVQHCRQRQPAGRKAAGSRTQAQTASSRLMPPSPT